jgi:hypothetical protein
MRGACGVLQQVGYFGDDDFNLGILLDGSCRVCGGRRCWHSYMAGSYVADLEGEDADENMSSHEWYSLTFVIVIQKKSPF